MTFHDVFSPSQFTRVALASVLPLALLASVVEARDALHASVSSDGRPITQLDLPAGAVAVSPSFDGDGRPLPPTSGDIGLSGRMSDELGGPASDGISRPGAIIGTDSRTRITGTTSNPYRKIVLITRGGSSNTQHCTGWLINKNTVATAGHCVHTGGSGGTWYDGLRVRPGNNGSSAPFGFCSATRLFSVTGWTNSGNRAYDYGAIKLNCNVGNTTGWFGFFTTNSITSLPSTITGYPGDKPYGQLWRSFDSRVDFLIDLGRRILYQNDTFGGMSGSPVYYNRSGCGWCSLAIHTAAHNSSYNNGTRITTSVFNNLQSWKAAAP